MASALRWGRTFMGYFKVLHTAFGGVIGFSGLLLLFLSTYSSEVELRPNFPDSIFVVIVGAAVFLVGSVGCYDAVLESHRKLVMFAILLMVIIVFEIVAGVTAVGFVAEFVGDVFDRFKAYRGSPDDVALLQGTFGCCGKDGPSFWNAFPSHSAVNCSGIRQTGCVEKITNVMASVHGIVLAVFVLVDIVGIFCALTLAAEIKKQTRTPEEEIETTTVTAAAAEAAPEAAPQEVVAINEH